MALADVPAHARAGAAPGTFDVKHPAGFLVRLAAYIVDTVVFSLVFGTTLGVLAMGVLGMDEARAGEWISFYAQPLSVLYFAVLVAIWRTTVGKRLFGLYVVCSDGSRVGFGRALARALAMILSGLILGIGFLMILFREDSRGLHDLICDTVVASRTGG